MNALSLLVPVLLAPVLAPPGPQCTLVVIPTTDVRAVAVVSDGSVIAAALSDRSVRLWELPTGRERAALKLAAPISEIAFAPGGRQLASLASGLATWDTSSGKRVLALPQVSAFQMAYAPDGTLAVAGYRLVLHDAATLQPVRTAAEGAGWLQTCVAFSGSGKLVAAGDTAGNFCVWDVATGKRLLRRKGHENRVTGVGFIDDGRTVVSGGSDARMKFWDLKSGRELGVFFPHNSTGLGRGIGALVCSPDGRTVVTAGADDGRIHLVEAATAQPRATLTVPGAGITSLSISRDGSTLVAGGKRNGKGVVASWRLYAASPIAAKAQRPALWQDLAGKSPAAYGAILWAASRPGDAVGLLRQRLHPVRLNEAVRKQCDVLIARLDHERFDIREQAQQSLEAMSPWVEPYLKQALARAKTLELQRRLQALLAKVGPSTLPLLRAIEVLEHVSEPDARQLLRQLADGEPTARITHEAQRALERAEKH